MGAGLRLRTGDVTVLADYDQHARIRGGDPERTMDAAATAYLALTVVGTDALLIAADHALRKEPPTTACRSAPTSTTRPSCA
ncbi:MAG TPA: hypothetical protein VI365_21740 [Trebonia sp.]